MIFSHYFCHRRNGPYLRGIHNPGPGSGLAGTPLAVQNQNIHAERASYKLTADGKQLQTPQEGSNGKMQNADTVVRGTAVRALVCGRISMWTWSAHNLTIQFAIQ